MIDPIHRKDNGRYFLDEMQAGRYGPFATEKIARAELDRYNRTVLADLADHEGDHSYAKKNL